MKEKLNIRIITFSSGERYPLLLDAQGIPDWYPTLYATTQVRNASKAPNTIIAVLSAIRILLGWGIAQNQDIEDRFSRKIFFNENELELLRQYTQRKAGDSTNIKPKKSSGKIERIRENFLANEDRISSSTQYIRMTYIADYLQWLAIHLAEKNNRKLDADTLKLIKKMIDSLRERRPQKTTRSRESARKGLTEEQQEILLQLAQPRSEKNVFSDNLQRRNQLIVLLLYHLGLRAGELLALSIPDFDFQANTLLIARRHDNKKDTRTYQPVVKTVDRRIPLSNVLMKNVSEYILHDRRQFHAAKKHDFLFVVHQPGPFQGQPLSLKGLSKIFQEIQHAEPYHLKYLTPHVLRHTANDRFSRLMDKQGISTAEEEKMRSYIMGWKEGSGTASTYTRRHIENKAREAALLLQKKSNREKHE